MKRILCLILIAAAASAAAAQKKAAGSAAVKFTSVYTDLNRDCKDALSPREAKEAEQRGQDIPLVCKGYGGYRINIGFSAAAAYLSVEKSKSDVAINVGTDGFSFGNTGKIEWRLANGKPFALIARFGKYKEMGENDNSPFDEKLRTGSRLVIKGLTGQEKIDFEVDGAVTDANAKARRMADENYKK